MAETKDYLLQFNVGPVQGFISAARRTRDLWFGSTMLSELSKAAAASLVDADSGAVRLIFPNPENVPDWKENVDFNVANVILAEAHGVDEAKLRQLCDVARVAVQARLERFKTNTVDQLKGELDQIDLDLMDAQLKDVIEFYAAWAPLDGDYKKSRRELAAKISARKTLRDFLPNPHTNVRGPKSSLDGLRESVFKRDQSRGGYHHAVMFQIKDNEALDAVGLIKRIAGKKTYPSVMRVAIDPWVRGHLELARKIRDKPYADGKTVCEWLAEKGALTHAKVDGGDKLYEDFPFDGSALYVSRHAALVEDVNAYYRDEARLVFKEEIEGTLRDELKKTGESVPEEAYFVVLQADGDRMGKMISGLEDADKNREFSRCLASFAAEAREVVRRNNGVCVYTGGDDVLAFLPLDTALKCARDLHTKFKGCLEPVEQYAPEGCKMTLSVGVSIASAQEDLEFLRKWGADAEKLAKKPSRKKAQEKLHGDRDGLAVTLRTRGSDVVIVRERWRKELSGIDDDAFYETFRLDTETPLDARLRWWALAFKRGAIPARFPYELREAARMFMCPGWNDKATGGRAARADTRRIFARKDVVFSADKDKNKERLDMLDDYIDDRLTDTTEMAHLADELIIAKWIADAERAADPAGRSQKGASA